MLICALIIYRPSWPSFPSEYMCQNVFFDEATGHACIVLGLGSKLGDSLTLIDDRAINYWCAYYKANDYILIEAHHRF